MTPWMYLTKKELKLGLPSFIYSMIGSIGILTLLVALGMKEGFVWEAVMTWAVIGLMFNFFYLVFYMSYSLNVERRRMHLWLHNPLSSYKLLLAKFVSGFFYMFIFLFTIIIGIGVAFGNINVSVQIENWQWTVVLSMVNYFIFMVLIGCIYTFFWTVYMSLVKSFSPFFSFVLTIFIAVLLFSVIDFVSVLFQWGVINSYVITGFEFTVSNDTFHTNVGEIPTTFYIGQFIESLLFISLFFIGSAWMLDRKVEV